MAGVARRHRSRAMMVEIPGRMPDPDASGAAAPGASDELHVDPIGRIERFLSISSVPQRRAAFDACYLH
jgi:hypothetical protein